MASPTMFTTYADRRVTAIRYRPGADCNCRQVVRLVTPANDDVMACAIVPGACTGLPFRVDARNALGSTEVPVGHWVVVTDGVAGSVAPALFDALFVAAEAPLAAAV